MFFAWVPLNDVPPISPLVQAQAQLQSQLQPHSDVQETYAGPSHQRMDSVGTAGSVSIRQGRQVLGSYDGRTALPDSHYEHLDSCKSSFNPLFHRSANTFQAFYVRNADFFIEGRVCIALRNKATSDDARCSRYCLVKQPVSRHRNISTT